MDTLVDDFLTVGPVLVFKILVESRFGVLDDWSPTGDVSGRYLVTSEDLDPPSSPAGREIVNLIAERKPAVEVLVEHQILWPAGKLALGAGQELSTGPCFRGS